MNQRNIYYPPDFCLRYIKTRSKPTEILGIHVGADNRITVTILLFNAARVIVVSRADFFELYSKGTLVGKGFELPGWINL